MADYIFSISPNFIKLPSEEEFNVLSNSFLELGRIPKTLLSIYGTHIKISATRVSAQNYYNRKQCYSINIIAAVDANKKFRYVSKHYGSAHDLRVYRTSITLMNWANELKDGFHIVADKAYRGYSNILIPGVSNDIGINIYTENLARQRLVVENRFGLFKGKFRRFYYKQFNGNTEKAMKVLVAAMVLHNLLLDL